MFPDDDAPEDDEGFRFRPPEGETREGWGGFVPDFVKKMAIAGLGAVFMTEEGIRNLAKQLKLPKEMLTFILSQAEKTKEDIGRVVSEELRRFLQSEKLREEFLKLVSGMTVEIKAQVRLVPDTQPKREGEPDAPRVVISELKTTRARRGRKE